MVEIWGPINATSNNLGLQHCSGKFNKYSFCLLPKGNCKVRAKREFKFLLQKQRYSTTSPVLSVTRNVIITLDVKLEHFLTTSTRFLLRQLS